MSKFISRYWTLIGIAIALSFVGYYSIIGYKKSRKAHKEKIKVIEKMIPSYALELRDVHYVNDDPKKDIKWELDAKKVRFSKDKTVILFSDFHLIVHEKGKQDFSLSGEKGRYERKKGLIYLEKNIEAIYAKKYHLYTEHLVFNEDTGKGYSNDPVRIKGPFFEIEGRGLSLDIKNKRLGILSNAKSIVYENI